MSHDVNRAPPTGKALLTLSLGALGVVYGDIGTSPLYAVKECFSGTHAVFVSPQNVLGILSLIFWALAFVVTFKYLLLVMRADNNGEGGVIALMALVGKHEATKRGRKLLLLLGLFGAALLYGDGVITPAISVLSAVEGLAVGAPGLQRVVVPVAVVILIGIFAIQKHGTATVGALFGPVMLVWFVTIGVLGIRGILHDPTVFRALWPGYAFHFFVENRSHGFLVLGAVVLVITGGEALYADMGHFGPRPIRFAWFTLAMPALILNYFGQGAILLHDPAAASNPFYMLSPSWFVYPLVGIATAAAIVASQALISGAFSLTRQAIQLGYCPRLTIRHTSSSEIGQIFAPGVNGALAVATVALVFGFRSSSALASAYGVAVTGTMLVTTLLFHRVMRDLWKWRRWKAWPLTVLMFSVDAAFLAANMVKVKDGGWFPIAAAIVVYTLFTTWKRGRDALGEALRGASLPLDLFLPDLAKRKPVRVPGTAVFMTSNVGIVPAVLLHHLKHNKVLHERVVLVSLLTEDVPAIPERERVVSDALGEGFYRVVAHYGFMETPDVPKLLASLPERPPPNVAIPMNPMDTTFYLGRETLLPTGPAKLWSWRKRLFIIMARNSATASQFFGLPPNRVVEMGAQIQL